MTEATAFIQPIIPWIIFGLLVLCFTQLFRWAKKRKTGAVVFMSMVQMLMPDPYAERTIKTVQDEKKTTKKEQDENGDPLENTNANNS